MKQNIAGNRYGMLVALSPHHPSRNGWYWNVRCDCGTEKVARASKLTGGKIKSCGCSQWVETPERHASRIGHFGPRVPWSNWIGTPTYRSWAGMLSRCTNQDHDHWEYYGATGIVVCERWRVFGNFLADMGPRPPGTSIDRWPDPHGDYEPGNCRWATPKQQMNNKRPWGTVAAKKFPKMKNATEKNF